MPVTKIDRSLMTTLSLLLMAVLAMGCFLFPMSDPEKSVMDLNLLGMWADEDGKEAMVFLPHDKRTYTLLTMKKKPDGKKWGLDDSDMGPAVYKAFVTEVDGDRYLNIQFMAPSLTYNPAQNEKGDLEKIAEVAAEAGNQENIPEKLKNQRLAIARKQIASEGIAPGYLIAKISIKGNQMTWQMSKALKVDDHEYQGLKSIDEVRAYILKKSAWEEPKSYTFVNQLKEGKGK